MRYERPLGVSTVQRYLAILSILESVQQAMLFSSGTRTLGRESVQYLIFGIQGAAMTILKKTLALMLVLTFSNSIAATLLYSTENGAIDGYDPVSYFVDGRAERGSADITAEWNGAVWRFVSHAHRDMFTENPEKFAPQYGGYCALGMAHGGAVPTNPAAWTIYEGKLYLNMIEEVTITWRYNPDRLIERANLKWNAMNSD